MLGHSARWEGFEDEWRVPAAYQRAEAAHAAARWQRAKAQVVPKVERWRRSRPNAKQMVARAKLVDRIPREYRCALDYGARSGS